MKQLCILGAGKAGLTLAKEIRQLNPDIKLVLIDRRRYFWENKDLFYLLAGKDKSKVVDLKKLSQDMGVEFINKEATKVIFRTKTITFKDKTSIDWDNLVIATGFSSKILPIKGTFYEDVFYLSEIDLYKVYDCLKVAKDIIVFSSTFLGIKLALYLSLIDKEVKVVCSDFSFLRDRKEEIIAFLQKRNITVYKMALEQIVGEKYVKAVKLSNGKFLSANCVFLDSGFTPRGKVLIDEGGQNVSLDNVYLLGDANIDDTQEKFFFFNNSQEVEEEAKLLARYLIGEKGSLYRINKVEWDLISRYIDEELEIFLKLEEAKYGRVDWDRKTC